MGNHITGPFVRQTQPSGNPSQFELTTWYRQNPPFDKPLPYSSEKGWCFNFGSSEDASSYVLWAKETRHDESLYAQAYAKFVDKLGESAGLGIDLTQWRQSDEMIRKRLKQLAAFTKAVLRRDPSGIAASLGISLKDVKRLLKTRHGVSKALSDLWLEFWFGWKPLVHDIFTALEVFDRDIPVRPIRVQAKQEGPISTSSNFPFTEHGTAWTRDVLVLGAKIKVTNPMLHLLQQFGIINPAAIAWDAVPWSFVVDWFGNVSSYLNSFTDFAGVELVDGYQTSFRALERGYRSWAPWYSYVSYGTATLFYRTLVNSFPVPPLHFDFKSVSPVRALTAITLLSQQLFKVSR